jgi:hypothetical protein
LPSAYLDFSGNSDETAGHIGLGRPVAITIFDGEDAALVRLYWRGE